MDADLLPEATLRFHQFHCSTRCYLSAFPRSNMRFQISYRSMISTSIEGVSLCMPLLDHHADHLDRHTSSPLKRRRVAMRQGDVFCISDTRLSAGRCPCDLTCVGGGACADTTS